MAKRIQYADDDTNSLKRLIKLRTPSLAIGLLLGILLSFVTSRFELLLSQQIQIAFFIPFVVYMADAVGHQTQNIYVRDLKSGKASFKRYLIKEAALGIIFGICAGLMVALITTIWFASFKLTLAISLAMFAAVAVAPLVALIITEISQLEHEDPAVSAGPIATIVQDTLSILIYGLIASLILL